MAGPARPRRVRRRRSYSWIVGPLALLLAFAGIGWLVVRAQRASEDDAKREEAASVEDRDQVLPLDRLPTFASPAAPTLPGSSVGLEATKLDLAVRRLGPDRYQVDGGAVLWVMTGDPVTELEEEDVSRGVVVRSRSWSTVGADRSTEVLLFDPVGPIDAAEWTTAALDELGPQMAGSPRPSNLVGHAAFETVERDEASGRRWTTRTLAAAVDGTLVVARVIEEGHDPAAGQARYLQLIASFSPS